MWCNYMHGGRQHFLVRPGEQKFSDFKNPARKSGDTDGPVVVQYPASVYHGEF